MAANLIILEFDNVQPNGEPFWPPSNRSVKTTSDTFTTQAATKFLRICADADCRVAFGGSAATAADMPIISATDNPFPMSGGIFTLKFI